MKSTMETMERSRVRLAIEVSFPELESALATAGRPAVEQLDVAGLRPAKLPFQAIDRRAGASVLPQALEQAMLTHIFAAAQEHEVNLLGRPEVAITDCGEGRPLRFTAEADVRPQIVLPELSSIVVEVKPIVMDGDELQEQLDDLRRQFADHTTVERPAADGDLVRFGLTTTVDGVQIPGGQAGDLSHTVGAGTLPADLDDLVIDTEQLLTGLDAALIGLSANGSATLPVRVARGGLAGTGAEVTVTVLVVQEPLLPPLDDSFARQVGSFETLDELLDHLRAALTRRKRSERMTAARAEALKQIIAATVVPEPESVVRDEVEHRRMWMSAELERMGSCLPEYLAAADKTYADIDAELRAATAERVRSQLVLDTVADTEEIQVSDGELGNEIVRRAQRAGVTPEAYRTQLTQAGSTAAFVRDIRRGKALAVVLTRVTMTDSNGTAISLEDLLGTALAEDHEHETAE